MAFSLSGTLITQTGTNTTMVGATGTTNALWGNVRTVNMGGNRLSVAGSLTISTEAERIINTTAYASPNMEIQAGGTLKFKGTSQDGVAPQFGSNAVELLSNYTTGFGQSIRLASNNPASPATLWVENAILRFLNTTGGVCGIQVSSYTGANRIVTRGLIAGFFCDANSTGNSRYILDSEGLDLQADQTIFGSGRTMMVSSRTPAGFKNVKLVGMLQIEAYNVVGATVTATPFIADSLDDSLNPNVYPINVGGGGWLRQLNSKAKTLNTLNAPARWSNIGGQEALWQTVAEYSRNIKITTTDLTGATLDGTEVIIKPIGVPPAGIRPYNSTSDYTLPSIYSQITTGGLATINNYVFAWASHNWSVIGDIVYNYRNNNGVTGDQTIFLRKYGYQIHNQVVNLWGLGDLEKSFGLAALETTLTEAQASALTGITIDFATKTATLTEAHTVSELFDYYQYQLTRQANTAYADDSSFSNGLLDLADWNIVGVNYLTGNIKSTGVLTASGAISNLIIDGSVNQDVPTDLTNASISGFLAYNTNINTSISYANSTLNIVRNDGTGTIQIEPLGTTTVTDYTDPQIFYVDSKIILVGATEADIYLTESDANTFTNPRINFSNELPFKLGQDLNGVTLSGTIYMRVLAGGVSLPYTLPLVLGNNPIDLGVQGQLLAISQNVESLKQPSIEFN